MTDTFAHDLRQEPEILFDETIARPDGGRHWPHLVFAAPDGFRPLFLDLSLPPGPGPHPVLVYVHGGGWMIGTPKYGNPTLRALDLPGQARAAGLAFARVSYRLSGEAHWPVPHQDIQAALAFLTLHAGRLSLDPARIAVLGESAGGHLAAWAGLDPGPGARVAAVVNWYGAVDLTGMLSVRRAEETGPRPERRLLGEGADLAARARAASPLHADLRAAPPFLHQHGDADRVVPLSQAQAFHAALLAAGRSSTLEVIAGADHCFWGANDRAIARRAVDFVVAALG